MAPYKHWAFISYRRSDEGLAADLLRRLETYQIPRGLTVDGVADVLPRRLFPVFRDEDELSASGDLVASLYNALDGSRSMILIVSPGTAASPYVEREVAHFLGAPERRPILVVVNGVSSTEQETLSCLPEALREQAARTGSPPLWLSTGVAGKLDQRSFLRLVAGILDTTFDSLWRRERRRRNRRVLGAGAGVVLAAAVLAATVWLEQPKPAYEFQVRDQVQAFQQYYAQQARAGAAAVDMAGPDPHAIGITAMGDLNDDGLLDYVVANHDDAFCGAQGCATEAYLTTAPGRYTQVLDLQGYSEARIEPSRVNGYAEIAAFKYMVDGTLPLYTIFDWKDGSYAVSRYDYCPTARLDYCTPVELDPVAASGTATDRHVNSTVRYHAAPDPSAPVLSDLASVQGTIIAATADGAWYVVDTGASEVGFVDRASGTAR